MDPYTMEKLWNKTSCLHNCSSNGECVKGTCICYIQYTGITCSDTNLHYYLSFSSFFYLICIIAFIQLILRIRLEHNSSPQPSSIFNILKPDSQKLIYIFVICATGSRAVYFLLGINNYFPDFIKNILFFIFYPFMFSVFSIVICFWAESFHLNEIQFDKPRFLTKSFCGFIVLNTIVYILFIGQVIANKVLHVSIASKINIIFNACIALFMFFVLVFFLIYGVEIFCKIKGAFKKDESLKDDKINYDQLVQSRFGLIIEAVFQLALTLFLVYDVLGRVYSDRMTIIDIIDRNIIKIVFHIVELGCIAWFPCCLWNVYKPGKLWILNPRNLLLGESKDIQEHNPIICDPPNFYTSHINMIDGNDGNDDGSQLASSSAHGIFHEATECWICLSGDDIKNMIQPCKCNGGMKLVHHDCLKSWLIEKPSENILFVKDFKCDICKASYLVEKNLSFFNASKSHQRIVISRILLILATLISGFVSIYFIWHRIERKLIKCVIFFVFFLTEYCILRLLGCNFVKVYNIAKKSALVILDSHHST